MQDGKPACCYACKPSPAAAAAICPVGPTCSNAATQPCATCSMRALTFKEAPSSSKMAAAEAGQALWTCPPCRAEW